MTTRHNRAIAFIEDHIHAILFSGTLTILTVSAIHFMQAVAIVLDQSSVAATATLALKNALMILGTHHNRWILAAMLVVSSSMATFAAIRPVGKARIFLLIAQHLFLGMMTVGCIYAVILGRYLDGTVVPRMHIWTDQLPVIVLFIFHTIAIILRSWVQDE